MPYTIEYVANHVQVYDADGRFLFSADNKQEAMAELDALPLAI